jgi:2-polyprenyl-3-methyl-5-hydroxy-6-metoxy-1,4-benzoquinol methylase
MDKKFSSIESSVVGMYADHPSPSARDKIAYASRRMKLRLYCCGVTEKDFVGKKVLDAGCGTGEYSCWFASCGANVTGIDLSDNSIEEGRQYADENGITRVTFEKRSVLQTGFEDNSFDFVYCTGVLHHIPDPFGGLKELCRITRPGGKILVSFYNLIGFLPREARRRIARFLGGNELDKRVVWGSRLFPFVTRRLLEADRNDPKSGVYDYFAIPHETLHSIGEVLMWFDQLGLQYEGTFAPSNLRDYPAMFVQKNYKMVEDKYQNRFIEDIMGKFGIQDMDRTRPGQVSRLLVQLLWLVCGVDMFSICGRKQGRRDLDY